MASQTPTTLQRRRRCWLPWTRRDANPEVRISRQLASGRCYAAPPSASRRFSWTTATVIMAGLALLSRTLTVPQRKRLSMSSSLERHYGRLEARWHVAEDSNNLERLVTASTNA